MFPLGQGYRAETVKHRAALMPVAAAETREARGEGGAQGLDSGLSARPPTPSRETESERAVLGSSLTSCEDFGKQLIVSESQRSDLQNGLMIPLTQPCSYKPQTRYVKHRTPAPAAAYRGLPRCQSLFRGFYMHYLL